MLYAARLFQVALHALVALAAWIENTRCVLSLREACDKGVFPNDLPMN